MAQYSEQLDGFRRAGGPDPPCRGPRLGRPRRASASSPASSRYAPVVPEARAHPRGERADPHHESGRVRTCVLDRQRLAIVETGSPSSAASGRSAPIGSSSSSPTNQKVSSEPRPRPHPAARHPGAASRRLARVDRPVPTRAVVGPLARAVCPRRPARGAARRRLRARASSDDGVEFGPHMDASFLVVDDRERLVFTNAVDSAVAADARRTPIAMVAESSSATTRTAPTTGSWCATATHRPRAARGARLLRRLGLRYRALAAFRRGRGRPMKIIDHRFVTLDGVSQGPGSADGGHHRRLHPRRLARAPHRRQFIRQASAGSTSPTACCSGVAPTRRSRATGRRSPTPTTRSPSG